MTRLRQSLTSIILLLATVIAGCGGGPAPAFITATGTVTFDLVPTNLSLGLDYTKTIQKPARGIVIEAIKPDGSSVLASTSTDNSGNYSVTLPSNTDVKIRAKAQLKSSAFDFQVVDNTSAKALYVMDSMAFNTGASNQTKNLNAASGWIVDPGTGIGDYKSTRAAAPFAILDTVYKCVSKVMAADPAAIFAPLQINWSVSNISDNGDVALGQIGTSYYDPYENALYILGSADNDTDEYDDHVIAHEWGHYFEEKFSRADSLGGNHGRGNKLDPRVAFGEGWGNAFSGMATDNKDYVDTSSAGQGYVSVHLDLSDSNGDSKSIGWFSEDSIQYILYSLYKSVGFAPIYDVLVHEQKTANSFTSIYSFSAFLKSKDLAYASTLNTLLSSKSITTTAIDQWDSSNSERNDGGSPSSLPVYKPLTIKFKADFSVGNTYGTGNRLLNRSFFVFTVPAGTYSITVARLSASKPALKLYSKGNRLVSSVASDFGTTQVKYSLGILRAGTYYGEVYEAETGGSSSATYTLTLD